MFNRLPSTAAPSLKMGLTWTTPRPNNVARNGKGPEMYKLDGANGQDDDVTGQAGAEVQTHMFPGTYSYNTAYDGVSGNALFRVKPYNSGTDGIDNSDAAWSTKKCTTPIFRPAAPSVTIVRIADRRVWICLLYTSPSPRDRQKPRMPSSA